MAKKETLGAYLNRNIEEKGSTLSKEKAKGKKYKSISAAKKAGALYYTNKAGKIMAAVYGEDLKVRPAAKKPVADSKITTTKLPPSQKGDLYSDRHKGSGPASKNKPKVKPITEKTKVEVEAAMGGNNRGDALRTSGKFNKRGSGMNKGGMAAAKKKAGYAAGGMPMVMKGGTKVPAFAADGKGKMNMGGMAKKKPAAKMMAGGMAAKKKPAAKKMMGGGMAKKSGYMYGGMAKKKK